MDAEDFLFVALNDSSYADWRASRSAEDFMAQMHVEKADHESKNSLAEDNRKKKKKVALLRK